MTYYVQAGRTIMKLQIVPEWTLLGGLMKANFNKKYEQDDDKNSQNGDRTGDYFYDFIGKYCNTDATK
jgi:hypothetical protein